MHVDDRLATVLNARGDSKVAMRIQYRQLLDLVGTSPAEARSDLLDAAHVRLAELASAIPHDERARALAAQGVRLRNPRLIAMLASDHPSVGLAAINAARLTEEQWLDLVPALPITARGLARHRRDLGPAVEARLAQLGIADRGLPPLGTESATPVTAPPPPAPVARSPAPSAVTGDNILHLTMREEAPSGLSPTRPAPADNDGIGAIVRRIEAFRKMREGADAPQPANDAPRLPLGENDDPAAPGLTGAIRAFAFSTDAAGRIGWADPAVAAMVCGMLIPAAHDEDGGASTEAFRRRQPIRAASVTLEGAPAIAGDWVLDAGPQFDAMGHFSGYAGRFRRPAPAPAASTHNPQADRIRQILHELRTPVNAIQGFAEMIHQQLFGAAPHEYRALAANIAADAARMLAGFDELDRLARLDVGALEIEPGQTDLAMTVAGIVHQLEPHTASRSSGFSFAADAGELTVGLAPVEAERLVWRVLATLAGAARPGEFLDLAVRRTAATIVLSCTLPAALEQVDDLFEATAQQSPQALSAGVFGSGFALRLAAAEARAASGRLDRDGATLHLVLPVFSAIAAERGEPTLTHSDSINTPSEGPAVSAR